MPVHICVLIADVKRGSVKVVSIAVVLKDTKSNDKWYEINFDNNNLLRNIATKLFFKIKCFALVVVPASF